MMRYLDHRGFSSLALLAGLSVLAFALVRLVPGDTVTAMLGTHYDQTDAAALREQLGLDTPLAVQYAVWIGRVIIGDWGQSITGRSVLELLGEALPVTLQLAAMSLLIAVVIGLPLGTLAAIRHRGPVDHAASTASLLGISVPDFWLGAMLMLVLSITLGWLPPSGYVPIGRDPAANLAHMIMPALALGMAVAAVVMRMTRASLIDVLGQDHVRTARAKGLSPMRVVMRHGLANALVPVVTITGVQAGYLLGGSVVIETLFALPGLGRLALQAIERRDYPLLQGAVLLIGLGFIAVNLAVDLLYGYLDPRMRETHRA